MERYNEQTVSWKLSRSFLYYFNIWHDFCKKTYVKILRWKKIVLYFCNRYETNFQNTELIEEEKKHE